MLQAPQLWPPPPVALLPRTVRALLGPSPVQLMAGRLSALLPPEHEPGPLRGPSMSSFGSAGLCPECHSRGAGCQRPHASVPGPRTQAREEASPGRQNPGTRCGHKGDRHLQVLCALEAGPRCHPDAIPACFLFRPGSQCSGTASCMQALASGCGYRRRAMAPGRSWRPVSSHSMAPAAVAVWTDGCTGLPGAGRQSREAGTLTGGSSGPTVCVAGRHRALGWVCTHRLPQGAPDGPADACAKRVAHHRSLVHPAGRSHSARAGPAGPAAVSAPAPQSVSGFSIIFMVCGLTRSLPLPQGNTLVASRGPCWRLGS